MIPANPILWDQLLEQAKAKYPSHRNPKGFSFPAGKWVRDEYQTRGGQFVDSKDQIDPRFRDYKKEDEDRKKRKQQELKRKKKQQNLL